MEYSLFDYSNVVNSAVHQWMSAINYPIVTNIMVFITNLGNPIAVFLISVVIFIALLLKKKTKEEYLFAGGLLACALVNPLIKNIVKLPRPVGSIAETGYSFTSGHAAFSTTFVLLLLYILLPSINKKYRAVVTFAGLLIAFLIGMSRLYLGVHYATDVIGGFVLGAVIAALSIYVYKHFKKGK